MKILLINPPTPNDVEPPIPPLGLAYIAAVLEKEKIPVRIIDLDLERERMTEIREILSSFKPKIVGISGLTPQMDNVYKIAAIIKDFDKQIVVVIGGAHASALQEKSLLEGKGNIDIVVIGEGEFTFLDIAKGTDLNSISGIAYLDKLGNCIINRKREPISDLDDIPLPARHLLRIDKYKGWIPTFAGHGTHIIASRGCPFNCIYCSEKAVFGKNHRRRNPKNVVDEIEFLVTKYGLKEVYFYDDLFTLNKKWVIQICDEIISRKIRIKWKALSRVDTIDNELLKKMKEAGCWLLYYGFESGSQEILNNIRKKTTVEQSIESAKLTKKVGIKIAGFFMIGNPGETKKTISMTLKLAKKVDPDYYQFTITRPDPGSDLYNLYRQKIENMGIPWSEYYAFPCDLSRMPIVGTDVPIRELIRYRDVALLSMRKKTLMIDLLRSLINLNLRRIIDVHLPALKNHFHLS